LTVIKTYENKISELERNKLLIAEKLTNGTQPKHSFDEMFELAIQFIGDPHRIWASGHIHLQRIVLRLGFAERICYHRENGFSNVIKSLPFKVLEDSNTPKVRVVGRARFERATT
ncbi:MAG: hypothetical protein JKX81_12170, partial [Arenicella sp.]|nr:hypothetical protein [Arenicella sp.]